MTVRTNTKAAHLRAVNSVARCTIRSCDDGHDMQEIKQADIEYSTTQSQFERWQPVGFSSYPMDQDQSEQQQPQQSGNGGGGLSDMFNDDQPKGPCAEGLMIYPGGDRSHPICAGIDDRRSRPHSAKAGESFFYSPDGSGQTIYHRRRNDGMDGLYILTLDDDQSTGTRMRDGSVMMRQIDGTQQPPQSRFVSIRHVQKPKQQRKSAKLQKSQGGGGGGGDTGPAALAGAGQGQDDPYKHEGQSVNTEQRMTGQQIQYYDGDTNVGHYDRGKKDWLHHDGSGVKHSNRADQIHIHMKYELNHIWVDKTNCYSSKPLIIQPDNCS